MDLRSFAASAVSRRRFNDPSGEVEACMGHS
jgi:hypothetical protein